MKTIITHLFDHDWAQMDKYMGKYTEARVCKMFAVKWWLMWRAWQGPCKRIT